MQLQSENTAKRIMKYKNSFHCAQQVLKYEGISGLYRGFSASLLGLTESTLQFVLYESFKAKLLDYKLLNGEDLKIGAIIIIIGWGETTITASISKLTAAILTYPHEV